MPLETEIKFLGVDFDALRNALREAGADYQGRYFERNAVLDYLDRSLKARGALLRLRDGASCVLTLKLPGDGNRQGLKELDERQTIVKDFDDTLSIFEGLGLRPAFWYEKIREKWRLGRVEVDLDVLPFGRFAEIEGPADDLEEAVRRLGLSGLESTAASYHDLNLEHRRGQGLPLEDGFAFKPGEAERILKDSLIP